MATLPEDKKLAEVEQQLEEEVAKLEEKVQSTRCQVRFLSPTCAHSSSSTRPVLRPSWPASFDGQHCTSDC